MNVYRELNPKEPFVLFMRFYRMKREAIDFIALFTLCLVMLHLQMGREPYSD
jgi:hypothetical protein